MKLFFHIGIEKTGSSHLQSISAINRNELQKNGVWFPFEGKNDALLLKGEISAGNAQSLTDAIKTNNFNFCASFIAQHIQEAEEKSCHSLFLSNELLLIALAKEEKLTQFIEMLNRLDIFDIKFLLFLRNPIAQALSLYKHRAKSGKALDIEEWPKENYYYGEALISFIKQAQIEKINLTVRKFSKEKGALEKILFKEWLNIQKDLRPPPKVVNPSLSLSELILIKKIRKYEPNLVSNVYNRLILLNKEEKAEESTIENYHYQILYDYLKRYKKTWILCNELLSKEEALVFENPNFENESTQKKISSFSDTQLDVLASIVSESFEPFFWLKLQKTKLKGLISKLLFRLRLKKM